MTFREFFDTPEEIFIGACLQFPLVFVVGWWVIPIMIASGLLWRLGGVAGGNKLARRIGVPLLVCGASAIAISEWGALLAIPFMIWLAPSYGKTTFLFRFFTRYFGKEKADFLTRGVTYLWYWLVYAVAFALPF